jgi:glycerophosphoryl diester phosphodiesterase
LEPGAIALNWELGVKHRPELKGAEYQDRVDAIFGSQTGYAQKFIDELKDAGVEPKDVWVQSFNRDDVLYWIQKERAFGR